MLRRSGSIPPGLSGRAPPAAAALGAGVPTPKAVGRGEAELQKQHCKWDELVNTLLRKCMASRKSHVERFTMPPHQRV